MSAAPPADQDNLIASLSDLTGLAPAEAEQFLTAGNWDLQAAAALYFDEAAPTDPTEHSEMADDEPQNPTPNVPPQQQQQPGGGRTLAGDYVPPPPASSSSRQPARRQPQRGLRTLGDLQSAGASGHGHDDGDHDDDSDYQDDENQDFFAGGEKSGLAVQNPNNQSNPRDQINNILRRARQNAPRPGGDDEPTTSRFHGTGMTLGGDDAPSRTIPDPIASVPQAAARVRRELHLWRDGFSVDDGALFRYDDPANARTLEMINTGHAPLHILNVQQGQEVDVEVHAHKDEDFVQPKKKYVPFGGSGQRLGSPTPGASAFTPPPEAQATASTTPASASASASAAAPSVDVDSSVPTVTLRIQLGDGTRMTSRFNTTHTVADVYGFVDRASPASGQRAYVLATTFPTRELDDKAVVLGDIDNLKRGGNVVQKWK